ncbi:MAG: tRNA threonylcarbamoyladenosine dehydratase, partial [Clostridia bacterium]|nr:tRNA threonylcarbamoyladenosine dehydratase [Clostridia bacterium]
MDKKFIRTAALLGEESIQKLKNSCVAIFGVGGVGSYVFEALVRSGVGSIDVFDNDTVAESNINRQIIATSENIGVAKTDAATLRAKQINPDINIKGFNFFYLPETADSVDLSQYDYIVDAVDTVAAKLELAERADRLGIPLISIMGTGNKLDPTALRVDDIYKTEGCPLARVMRAELRKRNIKKLKVVWSA